jgi:hypothetical protein
MAREAALNNGWVDRESLPLCSNRAPPRAANCRSAGRSTLLSINAQRDRPERAIHGEVVARRRERVAEQRIHTHRLCEDLGELEKPQWIVLRRVSEQSSS